LIKGDYCLDKGGRFDKPGANWKKEKQQKGTTQGGNLNLIQCLQKGHDNPQF